MLRNEKYDPGLLIPYRVLYTVSFSQNREALGDPGFYLGLPMRLYLAGKDLFWDDLPHDQIRKADRDSRIT